MPIARRAIESLRRRAWGDTGIELVVVILGVFIGLQAANWNEGRLSAQRGTAFTERLKDDLRVEAWNWEMQIGYYSQVRTSAIRAADALSGHIALTDDALLAAAYRATQYNENTGQRTTYDELTSTGEMNLIADLGLRNLAVEIYSSPIFELISDEGRMSDYRKWFRKRVPHRVQFAVAEACGDRIIATGDFAGIATALDYPCQIDLPAAELAEVANLIRNDADALPLLRLRIADAGTNISTFGTYLPDLRDAMRRIAAEAP
ncbi:MAG TPA: hypothetical protein PLR28_03185 [Dokdonella sp.]|nr:hypothetical protein [Dokdonella sp.]